MVSEEWKAAVIDSRYGRVDFCGNPSSASDSVDELSEHIFRTLMVDDNVKKISEIQRNL